MSDCKTRAAQSGLPLSRSTDHGQSLAETRKSLKAEIDVLQDKLNEAAKIFRSGKSDPVPVKCDVIQDWNTDELVWVSADEEARELQRRKKRHAVRREASIIREHGRLRERRGNGHEHRLLQFAIRLPHRQQDGFLQVFA